MKLDEISRYLKIKSNPLTPFMNEKIHIITNEKQILSRFENGRKRRKERIMNITFNFHFRRSKLYKKVKKMTHRFIIVAAIWGLV